MIKLEDFLLYVEVSLDLGFLPHKILDHKKNETIRYFVNLVEYCIKEDAVDLLNYLKGDSFCSDYNSHYYISSEGNGCYDDFVYEVVLQSLMYKKDKYLFKYLPYMNLDKTKDLIILSLTDYFSLNKEDEFVKRVIHYLRHFNLDIDSEMQTILRFNLNKNNP
jgi:hypothetical protein